MATVKARDLRAETPDELRDRLAGLRKEAYNLRFQGATGQLENPARMRLVRREIARVMTVLGETARAGAKSGAAAKSGAGTSGDGDA